VSVRHCDAALLGGGEVDVIQSDAVGADRAKFRRAGEQLPVDASPRVDEHPLGPGERGGEARVALSRHSHSHPSRKLARGFGQGTFRFGQ
jgi:hypothetical protein